MLGFRVSSLADQVFEKLENDIIQGIYSRGEIITELRLVEELGVSRTPIREALRRLEQERLIEETGKGSVVLGITEENLLDIMDIRIHIEPMASYYAAINRTPEDIARLAHIIDLQDFFFAKHDVEYLHREDDDFHDAICAICKRSVISDILILLHRKTRKYRKLSLESDKRPPASLEEHRQIYKAIADGNGELAAELTAEHIKKAKSNMMERLGHNE